MTELVTSSTNPMVTNQFLIFDQELPLFTTPSYNIWLFWPEQLLARPHYSMEVFLYFQFSLL